MDARRLQRQAVRASSTAGEKAAGKGRGWGGKCGRCRCGSEQAGFGVEDAAQGIVVENDTAEAAVVGQSASLGRDRLCREDALHGAEPGIAIHQVEVS